MHKRRYDYHRITLELRNQGLQVNHKKILRLMNKLNLHSIMHKSKQWINRRFFGIITSEMFYGQENNL